MNPVIDQLKDQIEEFRTEYDDEATVDALLWSLRHLSECIEQFDPDNELPPASSWCGPLSKFMGPLASFYYGGRKLQRQLPPRAFELKPKGHKGEEQ